MICDKCNQTLDEIFFGVDKTRKTGRRATCKKCRNKHAKIASKIYYQKNKQKCIDADRAYRAKHMGISRAYRLTFKYGITPNDYDNMKQAQNGQCAICSMNKVLVIDHNHETGAVRDLLCHKCNIGLGHIENEEFRKKALKYLDHHANKVTP